MGRYKPLPIISQYVSAFIHKTTFEIAVLLLTIHDTVFTSQILTVFTSQYSQRNMELPSLESGHKCVFLRRICLSCFSFGVV